MNEWAFFTTGVSKCCCHHHFLGSHFFYCTSLLCPHIIAGRVTESQLPWGWSPPPTNGSACTLQTDGRHPALLLDPQSALSQLFIAFSHPFLCGFSTVNWNLTHSSFMLLITSQQKVSSLISPLALSLTLSFAFGAKDGIGGYWKIKRVSLQFHKCNPFLIWWYLEPGNIRLHSQSVLPAA